MRYIFKILVFINLIFLLNINAYATINDDVLYLNPEWIKYNELSDDERMLYEAIPQKYIYDYIPEKINILESNNKKYFSLDASDEIPEKYNLADITGKRYINSKNKNQRTLGLCWAFASVGSLESNILLNGVKGIDELIDNCTNNPNLSYCKNKEKYEYDISLNNYYINNAISCESGSCPTYENPEIVENTTKIISNATFSERIIDYIRSKPENAKAYNVSLGTYNIISEKYNPYNKDDVIGAGGNFSDAAEFFSYGITPTRTLSGIWETYKITHDTISLSDIYDNEGNYYQVTGYYNYPYLSSNATEDAKIAWINELKQNIMKYGSVYVSTLGPQSSSGKSCYYYDSKNSISLINDTGDCGSDLGYHAMQIIGWDDSYKFGYCKVTSKTGTSISYSSSAIYTKEECEQLAETTANSTTTKSGIWTEGTGAWILKNSWGSSTVYPYLSYQSTGLTINGVREVSVVNHDNIYNTKNTLIKESEYEEVIDDVEYLAYEFKISKTSDIEYLSRINFITNAYKKDYKVYVKVDKSSEYILVSEGYADYTGMYSVDINNFKLEDKSFYIKILGISATDVNAFTLNECSINNTCDTIPQLKSETLENYYVQGNTDFSFITKTQNIPSGEKVEYKFYNENNEDITDKFEFSENYIVKGSNYVLVESTEILDTGKYYLHSIYNDIVNIDEFNIIPRVKVNFNMPDALFLEDGSYKIDYELSSYEGISNYSWKSSQESIASIDNDGILTFSKQGDVLITLSFDTLYGRESYELNVDIYNKKIYTIEDFYEMISINKNKNAYYLMNDLDFKNEEYKISTITSFSGIFNGGFHTLKNMNFSGNSRVGIFPIVLGGNIKNLKIKDSVFKGATVGSIAGYSSNVTLENIETDAHILSTNVGGGLLGEVQYPYIYQCFNSGTVETISSSSYTYAGGLIGTAYYGEIYNSYNIGKIYSNTSWYRSDTTKIAYAFAGGIASTIYDTYIYNSYNIGEVTAETSVSENEIHIGGLSTISELSDDGLDKYLRKSYYIPSDKYTETVENSEKTLEEMKKKATFDKWDFDNIWYINEDKITPVLRTIPIEIEEFSFNIDSNILKTNSEYTFEYNYLPISVSEIPSVYSEDNELFKIENNKIITTQKDGTSNIVFKFKYQEFKFPITVEANYYNVNYYNEDKTTIYKSEQIKEYEEIVINYIPENYEDDLYNYKFDYWSGYNDGMIVKSDIDLIAVYRKIPKLLTSDIYVIENGIIKNIKLNNVNDVYSLDLFKSNLNNYKTYSLYNKNNISIDLDYIATGMKYKNELNEYIIILSGDVTGDGKVRMNDIMKIASHLVNKNVLFDEYLTASDVTGDGKVRMNDIMKIASSLVNGGSL